jgi:hypothetical protein
VSRISRQGRERTGTRIPFTVDGQKALDPSDFLSRNWDAHNFCGLSSLQSMDVRCRSELSPTAAASPFQAATGRGEVPAWRLSSPPESAVLRLRIAEAECVPGGSLSDSDEFSFDATEDARTDDSFFSSCDGDFDWELQINH